MMQERYMVSDTLVRPVQLLCDSVREDTLSASIGGPPQYFFGHRTDPVR